MVLESKRHYFLLCQHSDSLEYSILSERPRLPRYFDPDPLSKLFTFHQTLLDRHCYSVDMFKTIISKGKMAR